MKMKEFLTTLSDMELVAMQEEARQVNDTESLTLVLAELGVRQKDHNIKHAAVIAQRARIFCEDCCCEIDENELVTLRYDLALDADDGYGNYVEIHLCKECHEGGM